MTIDLRRHSVQPAARPELPLHQAVDARPRAMKGVMIALALAAGFWSAAAAAAYFISSRF